MGSIYHRTALAAAAVITLTGIGLAAARPAQAQIVNGSFETGSFSGWTIIGENEILGSVAGIGPRHGSFQALLETTNVTVAGITALESFVGADIDAVRPNGARMATQGSAIKQTFTAQAGQVLSVSFNFLTAEQLDPGTYNDFAFIKFGSLNRIAEINTGTNPGIVIPENAGNNVGNFLRQQTGGYKTVTFDVTQSGTHELVLGIVNVGDRLGKSGLLLDSIGITAVPEPGTGALLVCAGLPLLLAGAARQRRRLRKR